MALTPDVGYLVSGGSWFPVAPAGSVSRSRDNDPVSLFTSAMGQTTGFARGVGARTWGVSGTLPYKYVATLAALDSQLQDNGYWWFPPLATRRNLLTVTKMRYGQFAGFRELDGQAVPVWGGTSNSYNSAISAPAPPAGTLLGWSAPIQGGRARVEFKDSTGVAVGSSQTVDGLPTFAAAGGTVVVPDNATTMTVVTTPGTLLSGFPRIYLPIDKCDDEGTWGPGEGGLVMLKNLKYDYDEFFGGKEILACSYDLLEVTAR